MALVELATAKDHLNVAQSDDAHNEDIAIKAEQASAIVLDYLKARATAIASISVANPTVVTTTVPHSLMSGVTASILGTTTTPTVNGAQVVTVTGPTTFTVPVNVTVGQSTEAGSIGAPVWTSDTVPGHVQAAVLLVLGHLYENRGEDARLDDALWQAVGRLLMRSRDPAFA